MCKESIKIPIKAWKLINCCKIKNNKAQEHNFISIGINGQKIIKDYFCDKCGLGLKMKNKKYIKVYY